MRVLVVLPKLPAPEGGAAARCSVGLLRGLRSHGIDVTAVAAHIGTGPRPEVPDDLQVEAIGVIDRRTRVERYRDPASALARAPFATRVAELAEGADVIHLEEVIAAPAARGLANPTVTHLQCLSRLDSPLGPPWEERARQAFELRLAERRVVRGGSALVANAPELADEIRCSGGRDVTVVPLGLDPADYPADPPPLPPVAGLIGAAFWEPTANAVRHLHTEVWPRVLELRPDARVRLAGFEMTHDRFPDLPALPGVEWVGPVESAEGFLRSLGVLLYPVARGSGTKVKVLEAMALALPVVTTPEGAQGVAPHAGVAVAQDDAALAAATAALLADPEGRRGRGAAGRAQFLADHAPGPATAPLVALYERVLTDSALTSRRRRPLRRRGVGGPPRSGSRPPTARA